MRVGIVVPMWSEAQCIAPIARDTRRAEIGDGILVCVSGVGRERASAAVRDLLSDGATAIACVGVAGGLDPRLSAGDLVIADRVIAGEGHALPTDAMWSNALAERLRTELPLTIGAIADSSGVLAGAHDKRARFEATSALAVDMESAGVASEAAARGVPCLVLRAVCDPAHLRIPRCALDGTDANGNLRAFAFARSLLLHPHEIGAVLGLHRAFRRSQRALRAAIRIGGPSLCASAACARKL
jgi:adenosylhomocysteine nucleosidase